MGRSLALEWKDYKFQVRLKSMTFPHYLFAKNQFIKYAVLLLNRAWPIGAVRLMALRLQTMRKRDKNEGCKMCPHVNLDEIRFIEPTKNNRLSEDKVEKPAVEGKIDVMMTQNLEKK